MSEVFEHWNFEQARAMLEPRLYGKVLNVGAGNGDSTLWLRTLPRVERVISVDRVPIAALHHGKRFCRNVPDGVWLQTKAQDLGIFPAAHFDGIFCWDVFQHVEEPDRALAEFVRVCGYNGIVFIRLVFRSRAIGGSFDLGDVEYGSSGYGFGVHCLWDPEELEQHAVAVGLTLLEPMYVNANNAIHACFINKRER